MDSIKSLTKYSSDIGSRNCKEKSYGNKFSFEDILKLAIQQKASVIIKTKQLGRRPGAWYIKFPLDNNVAEQLVSNSTGNLYSRRECWHIVY